jgi:hypothetical protein
MKTMRGAIGVQERRFHGGARVTAAMLVLSCACTWGGSIAEAHEPPADKMDCKQYKTETSKSGYGLKVGSLLFSFLFGVVGGPAVSVTPEIKYEKQSGVIWDRAVHGIIARYMELCNRYNAGMVSKSEYDARLREIEALHREAQQIEARLFETVRSRADREQDELNQALGQKRERAALPAALDASIRRFSDKVDQLEPIGQPLKPAPPCPTPDGLGAPGAVPGAERNC